MGADPYVRKVALVITGLQIRIFFLVFARVAGLFMTAPVFNSKAISTRIKIGIAFWLSLSIMFIIPVSDVPGFSLNFLLILMSDVLLGVLIGLIANIIFAGASFAGSLMDMQMGMSVAQTFDPMVGAQVTIMERIMQYYCLLLFISVKGHHLLLGSVYESFKMFPATRTIDFTMAYMPVLDVAKQLFFMGMQVASPIILVIFLLDFCLGVVSRVAPQLNVFQLGFQFKPTIGAYVFVLLLPMLSDRVLSYLILINDHILNTFVILQGPR